MEKTDVVHCSRCGAKVSPGKDYCSNCGAQVVVIPPQTTDEYFDKKDPKQTSDSLRWAKILLTLYAGLALLAGFMLAGFSNWYVDMFSADQLAELLKTYGLETKDQLVDLLSKTGIIVTISGALALVSDVLCFIRRYNIVAVVICAIASLVNVATVFIGTNSTDAMNIISLVITVIVGFVVAFLVYKSRPDFKS